MPIDSKLSWNEQINKVVRKATASLWVCRRRITHWLYTSVIRPAITNGALVWWPSIRRTVHKKKHGRLQRLACLGVSGVMRPWRPFLGLDPLHLNVEAQARRTSIRLNDWVSGTLMPEC